jgi:hypothetical protein
MLVGARNAVDGVRAALAELAWHWCCSAESAGLSTNTPSLLESLGTRHTV